MREPLTPPLRRSYGSTQRGRKVQAPSLSLAGSACTSLHEVDLGQCSRFAKRPGRKRTRRQNARFLHGNRNGKTTESAKRTFTKSTTHPQRACDELLPHLHTYTRWHRNVKHERGSTGECKKVVRWQGREPFVCLHEYTHRISKQGTMYSTDSTLGGGGGRTSYPYGR